MQAQVPLELELQQLQAVDPELNSGSPQGQYVAFMAEPSLQSKMSHSFKRSEPSHTESRHIRDAS